MARDFWSQDRTTIHQKNGWYSKLPPLQKFCYTLLLVFITGWCFFLGLTYAQAIAPEPQWVILDGNEWKKPIEGEQEINIAELTGVDVILLVGADKREGENRYRTDTIMLAFFNADTNELKLLSIPRDSYVQLPGKSTKTKINEAYFYGGLPLLEATIEYTFGIEVDHFAEVDFHGFLVMIDALGGVEIDVKQRMYKPTEEINIQPGLQTLSGYNALGFVRYRDLPMGDIDRIANQQAFIRALASKIASSSLFKAPQLVDIAMRYTNTNYTLPEALALGAAVLKTNLNDIPMYSLPGYGWWLSWDKNVWILKQADTAAIITEITGDEVGDFHIIGHGGIGSAEQPKKPGETAEPDVDGATGEPGAEGELNEEGLPPEQQSPAEGEEGLEPLPGDLPERSPEETRTNPPNPEAEPQAPPEQQPVEPVIPEPPAEGGQG